MSLTTLNHLLIPFFAKKHVEASTRHFVGMVKHFELQEWEDCIAKAGKFIEATLKALWVRAGRTVPDGRAFSAGSLIDGLGQLSQGSISDSIRLTIPRVSRFVYEIASNRGGRHDPNEIDPNEMDANVVTMNCSWVLAEMVRCAQHGIVGSDVAKVMVDSLVKKRYPLIEEVDGKTYFHFHGASAVDIALLALAHVSPRRISSSELSLLLKRHRFSTQNARVAVSRIRRYVDEDENGGMRLLIPGLRKAENLKNGRQT